MPAQPANEMPTAVASAVTWADWPSAAGTVTITAHVEWHLDAEQCEHNDAEEAPIGKIDTGIRGR